MVRPPLEAAGALRTDVEREERGAEPPAGVYRAIKCGPCRDKRPAALGDSLKELVGDEDDEGADRERDHDFDEREAPAIPALKGGPGL